MITIGFTGTRQIDLVSQERLSYLEDILLAKDVDSDFRATAVHGCAEGADSVFHQMCLNLNIPVYGRPATNSKTKLGQFRFVYMPEAPLVRNRKIVEDCDVLIAVPVNPLVEEKRSGTWATIRYARKLNKQIIII